MNRTTDLRYLMTAIMLAFLLSALSATTALADDSNPPVDMPAETTPLQEGEEIEAFTSPEQDQPASADDGAGDAPEYTPIEESLEPLPDDTQADTILDLLPDKTQLVILDENGEALPLASQEAEFVLYEGDPMWCPVGVTPNAGAGGCSPNFPVFGSVLGNPNTELLAWMATNDKKVAGVIWIAYNYASGPEPTINDNVIINGLTFANFSTVALTLQGGWNGVNGSKALNSATPYSTFNASLSILNWKAPVTINNIVVTGIINNTVTNAALYVESTKNITLNRVQVRDNNVAGYYGAFLNTTNAPLGAPAAVTVNDSLFNNNDGTGILIMADGAVRVKNITASYNGLNDGTNDYGLQINNAWDNPDQPVILSGTNEFKGNWGSGLYVVSSGAITLNNITASYNDDTSDNNSGDGYGMFIVNNIGATPSNVTLSGATIATFNQRDGLQIISNGNIIISSLNASFNGQSANHFGSGAVLDNCLESGPGCTTVGKSVTLNGTNTFNGNKTDGLWIRSSGATSLWNVTASNNGAYGVYMDVCSDVCPSPAPVTVNNSLFNNNGFGGGPAPNNGLYIFTPGTITLSNVTANYNKNGVTIDNSANLLKPANVTLNGTNNFIGNTQAGLTIFSFGAVKTNNLTASQNGTYGAYISNDLSSHMLVRKPVTMAGFNTFLGNGSDGLYVNSFGTIAINNLTAQGNGGNGATLRNLSGWSPGGGDQVPYTAAVTISGFVVVNNNFTNGLDILSAGAITLRNVTANGNINGNGIRLDNCNLNSGVCTTLPGPVLIAGYVHASYNGDYGLDITSHGAVTFSNVTANYNNGDGAYIINAYDPIKQANVTLNGVNNFVGNNGHGLAITSHGAVKTNNLTVNYNGGEGVLIDNRGFSGAVSASILTVRKPITMTGFNTFIGNSGNGLSVQTVGMITIGNLTANYNGSDGAYLNTLFAWKPDGVTAAPYAAPIRITGFAALGNNGGDGLRIISTGAVLLHNVSASHNGGHGAWLAASGSLAPQSVTLTGVNTFTNNGFSSGSGNGLYVQSSGAITISNLTASANRASGAFLDNYTWRWGDKFLGVTLTGVNTFQGNLETGVYIDTDGSAILSRITADRNGSSGVIVIARKNIHLTCGSAFGNTGIGIGLFSSNLLSIKGLLAYYNDTNEALSALTTIRTGCP